MYDIDPVETRNKGIAYEFFDSRNCFISIHSPEVDFIFGLDLRFECLDLTDARRSGGSRPQLISGDFDFQPACEYKKNAAIECRENLTDCIAILEANIRTNLIFLGAILLNFKLFFELLELALKLTDFLFRGCNRRALCGAFPDVPDNPFDGRTRLFDNLRGFLYRCCLHRFDLTLK